MQSIREADMERSAEILARITPEQQCHMRQQYLDLTLDYSKDIIQYLLLV